MMKALLACTLLLLSGVSWAQLEPAPSPFVACLVVPSEPLRYPEGAAEAKFNASYTVDIVFSPGAGAPSVSILEERGVDSLAAAVEQYVRRYRLPCAADAKEPVRLRQQFAFTPNDGRKVSWTRTREQRDGADAPETSCVTHSKPGSLPRYPVPQFGRLPQTSTGVVVAEFIFTAPDRAPQVRILEAATHAFGDEVTIWAQALRMPCNGGKPVHAFQFFRFTMSGEPVKVLKDAPLPTFLRHVKNLATTPQYFDLDQMKCPFEVRLVYQQPHLLNKVGELGEAVPARRPFLDWLATLQLDVPKATHNALLGDSATIAVPCGKIDL